MIRKVAAFDGLVAAALAGWGLASPDYTMISHILTLIVGLAGAILHFLAATKDAKAKKKAKDQNGLDSE